MNTEPEQAQDAPDQVSPERLAFVVVLAAVIVALVPLWILRGWDSTPKSEAFVSTPQFLVWVLVLCVQAAVWVGSAAFVTTTMIGRWRDLKAFHAVRPQAVIALAVAAIILILLAAVLVFGQRIGLYANPPRVRIPDQAWPLADHEQKVRPLVLISLTIGGLAIAGMWLASVGFAHLARNPAVTADSVTRFVSLRTELTAMLTIAGVLVGLATLSSGALREAVRAAGAEPVYRTESLTCLERHLAGTEDDRAVLHAKLRADFDDLIEDYPDCAAVPFDEQYVLAYGLLFTGILGIAFLPSHIVMRRAGQRLRDASYPLPAPGEAEFLTVVEQRQAFDALLQINLSTTATFKAGVAILTPLAASVLSTYLPA